MNSPDPTRPPTDPDDLTFFVDRVLTLLTATQIETALTWTGLPPTWRAVLQAHLRRAEAARHGIVNGGDA